MNGGVLAGLGKVLGSFFSAASCHYHAQSRKKAGYETKRLSGGVAGIQRKKEKKKVETGRAKHMDKNVALVLCSCRHSAAAGPVGWLSPAQPGGRRCPSTPPPRRKPIGREGRRAAGRAGAPAILSLESGEPVGRRIAEIDQAGTRWGVRRRPARSGRRKRSRAGRMRRAHTGVALWLSPKR